MTGHHTGSCKKTNAALHSPEKASMSDACSTSYRWVCMSSHAVSSICESAQPAAPRQAQRLRFTAHAPV